MATAPRSEQAWGEIAFLAGVLATHKLWPKQLRRVGQRLNYLAGLGGDDRTTFIMTRRELGLPDSYGE